MTGSGWRSWLVNGMLALASLAATLLACEGATALWVKTHPSLGLTAARLLRSHPPPYARSPYFSMRFVEEHELRGGTFTMSADGERILVRDAQGTYINNVGGHRVTTDVPEAAAHRIFLFGGSTVYCAEVPDPFTIASYLQRQVNVVAPGRHAVVNSGVSSVNTAQQLAWLRATDLSPGDVVVFYDGINDIFQGIFYRQALATIARTQQADYARLNALQRFALRLARVPRLSRTYVAEYLFYPFALEQPPPHVADRRQRVLLAQETARVYGEEVRAARAFTEQRGARFAHFLQPNLFSGPLRTAHEAALAGNVRIVGHGYREVLEDGQPALRAVSGQMQREGLQSVDLSLAFSLLPQDEDVFVDSMHVTEIANRLIAEAVTHALFGAPERLMSDARIALDHGEDAAVWERFEGARSAFEAGFQPGGPSLVENPRFEDGLRGWGQAQPTAVTPGQYPAITQHGYLYQEIRPLPERIQVEVTARCPTPTMVRVSVNWSDDTALAQRGVDRSAFDCLPAATTSRFVLSRPKGVSRAFVVVDAPEDERPAIVSALDVHALLPVRTGNR
jgi:hypothetical protein